MSKRYLGKYIKEEKGFLKKKNTWGELTVEADSFAEAQDIVSKRMSEFGIKTCIITPLWKEQK